MTHEEKMNKTKELMAKIIADMDELKELNADYWRVLIIAFMREEKKADINKVPVKATENDLWSIQELMLFQVRDAIIETTNGGKPYDPIAVRSWYGYDKRVRDIIDTMPLDDFNAIFGKLAEEIIDK